MVLTKYALIHKFTDFYVLTPRIFALTCFSILCLTAGGYIINDVLDIQADLINKPEKTFIGNAISVKKALVLYRILTFLGVGTCFIVLKIEGLPFSFFWTYLFTVFLLYLYSKTLKRLPLLGNVVIALFCGAIVYIIFLLDFKDILPEGSEELQFEQYQNNLDLKIFILFYTLFSFLGTLIREIIKDIEDIDGDYSMQMKTLPIVLGRKRTKRITTILSILFLIVLLMGIRLIFEDMNSMMVAIFLILFTLLPMIYFTYKLWSAKTKQQYHHLSNLMKLILFCGIISMILFTFV
jgi:4-hydroxybenzoate polyprenyltransferase